MRVGELILRFPRSGRVLWIGIRPGRREPVVGVAAVWVSAYSGLIGDHHLARSDKRQVTLLQFEHLSAVGSFLGRSIDASVLRRNLVVEGINLLALKGRKVRIGEAVLEVTGHCHPCSRMEEALGRGGFTAMRGHGGVTAKVVAGGMVQLGDKITVLSEGDGGETD